MLVNKESTREKLITLLKDSLSPLSGEVISGNLQISRVAVWKQVGKLEELGYVIASSRKGYQLLEEPSDLLLPHLFNRTERFYCLEEIDSTMNYADRIWNKDEIRGDFVVTAERQTAGRGRHRRDWISSEGGLFFTHALNACQPTALSYQLTMAALISLTEILRDDYKQPAHIKWPNDILIKDKKVMGLLSTSCAEGEVIDRLNLGIGINVNNAPPLPETTCSLSKLQGENLSRSDLMKRYLEKMKIYREERDPKALTRRFTQLCQIPAKPLSIRLTGGGETRGTVKEITPGGALVLDTGQWVYPGDCGQILK